MLPQKRSRSSLEGKKGKKQKNVEVVQWNAEWNDERIEKNRGRLESAHSRRWREASGNGNSNYFLTFSLCIINWWEQSESWINSYLGSEQVDIFVEPHDLCTNGHTPRALSTDNRLRKIEHLAREFLINSSIRNGDSKNLWRPDFPIHIWGLLLVSLIHKITKSIRTMTTNT